MNEELRGGEDLANERVKVIYATQEEMKRVTGNDALHLGATRKYGDGYQDIFLPEHPVEIFEEPVLEYMQLRTGSERDRVACLINLYGGLHEFDHREDELENEKETLKYLKNVNGMKNVYIVATIVNARDYLAGAKIAKDLVKEFPEIAKEARLLKKYLEGYTREVRV